MDFEWDTAKDRANRKKYGVSFDEARHIFQSPVFSFTDDRFDYGEKREISIGALENTVVVIVVHTERAGKTRIISARKANRNERKVYYDHLKKTP
jgi:uncharacterized DUF497 family protein